MQTHSNTAWNSNIVVCHMYSSLTVCFTGLLAGLPRADRVSPGVQFAAGSAPQQHHRTKMCVRWCRPVLHPNGCERYQHLKQLTAAGCHGPSKKGLKVVSGVRASTAGTSSKCCWCQCAPRWKQHVPQDCPREKQLQLMTSVGSSWCYNICLYILLL